MERRSAGIVVVSSGEVLLAKRNCGENVTLPGHWSAFAGGIEEGESPRDAAIRELFEESKIKVNGEIEFIGKTKRDWGGCFYLYAYNVKSIPFPELDFEHTEWGIFKIEHILFSPSPIDPWLAKKISELSFK